MTQMYVKLDPSTGAVVKGPQGVRGRGEHWYPLVVHATVTNPRTQTAVLTFDPECQHVVQTVVGDDTPTYGQLRAAQYPSLREQLDALWHDIHNDCLDKTGRFYNRILDVKDSNPKP